MAEIYDTAAGLEGPNLLTNIFNRGFVGISASIQIPGFAVAGARGKKFLIRAVGPRLADFGVGGALEDPNLELYRQGMDLPILVNNDWGDNPNAVQIWPDAAGM